MAPSFIWLGTGPFEFGDTQSLASMVPSALVRLLVLYVDSKWGEIVTCPSMSGLGFMLILHRTMGPKMTCLVLLQKVLYLRVRNSFWHRLSTL
jgi:hypothetical protein